MEVTAGHTAEANTSTEAEAHHGGDNPLFKFEPNVAFWTFVTFFILFFLLKKFAWGPILELLDKREHAIRESLAEAEKARTAAASSVEEQQRLLTEARREAQEIIAKNRADADRTREEMVGKARAEAEKIVASGRQVLEQETQAAIAQIRTAAVDLALGASAKLLGATVDDARNRELVQKYVAELQRSRQT